MPQDLYSKFVSESEGWDQLDEFNIQLYKATLARDIGRFRLGTKVDVIAFSFVGTDRPCVQIYEGDTVYEYPLLEISAKFGEEKVYSAS